MINLKTMKLTSHLTKLLEKSILTAVGLNNNEVNSANDGKMSEQLFKLK